VTLIVNKKKFFRPFFVTYFEKEGMKNGFRCRLMQFRPRQSSIDVESDPKVRVVGLQSNFHQEDASPLMFCAARARCLTILNCL